MTTVEKNKVFLPVAKDKLFSGELPGMGEPNLRYKLVDLYHQDIEGVPDF